MTLTAVFLHYVFLQYSGAFWRDEAGSITLATLPSVSDILHHLKYDSFPVLSFAILRSWTHMAAGNELWIRAFGLLVAVSILGIFWLNGRLLGYRVPLLSIALFVFNPLSFQIGDSIRPYGLGILLMLLAFGLLWKVTEQAAPWHIAAAAIVGILSVQCLYQNAFFVLAGILAGVIVTIHEKQCRKTVSLLAIGLAAALSLIPYLQIIKKSYGDVSIMINPVNPVNLPLIWHKLSGTLDISKLITSKFWIALLVLGLCAFVYSQVSRSKPNISKPQRDAALFCTITAVIYTVLFLLFLRFVCVTIRVWYFLPLMAVAAVFLDVMFGSLNLWSILRIPLAILVVTVAFGACWKTIHLRQTNIDIIASVLEKSAAKNDLIVLDPWYLAVSFRRYYNGQASYTTLPPLEDLKIHRYDLIKAKMASPDPLGLLLSEISDTLKSGGSVWIVGAVNFPPKDYPPQLLPPAPHVVYGWSEGAYIYNWNEYVFYFVRSHGTTVHTLPPVTSKSLTPYENCSMVKVQGWR